MASSLPIVALDGTLPSDVLQNEQNGYFVKNSTDLSNKIIKLIEEPELVKNMSQKSLEMAQKFSWRNIIESILLINEKI